MNTLHPFNRATVRMLFPIIALVGMVILQSCAVENEEGIKITGTVAFLSFEGGFYGIIGDDGKHYDPTNMSQEFQKDGLRVRFEAKTPQGMASYHQWGTLVELITIHKL